MNIPGYYFDQDKQRWFKIEDSRTAPGHSAWSSDAVKERKIEEKKASLAEKREQRSRGRIKTAWAHDPLTGGFLHREYGLLTPDVSPASFARGVVEKGCIPLADARWKTTSNIKNVCITSEDTKTGLGVGYVNVDNNALVSTYIPRDSNGRVHRRLMGNYKVAVMPSRVGSYEEFSATQISDIKFQPTTQFLFVASRKPAAEPALWAFRPAEFAQDAAESSMPQWRLGWGPHVGSAYYPLRVRDMGDNSSSGTRPPPAHGTKYFESNVIALAPESSPFTCTVGTNRGIAACDIAQQRLTWLAPSVNVMGRHGELRELFALTFRENHKDVMLAGGRPGRCYVADSRVDSRTWRAFRHPSSITHVTSLDENYVVVTGLQHTMCLYDLRMTRDRTGDPLASSQKYKPQLPGIAVGIFPDYQNNAHIHIGFDYDRETGIIAAAHDDGKVALYSARTGNRLKSPDIDQIQSDRGPIQAIQWKKMPRDVNPSLFVGINSNLNCYSFGVRDLKDEA